ncbi:Kinesin-like protein KIN-7O [Euphorbia peplus]|nr:Kinesin-like protein KIN-7O [Euphorbia peplus]
MERIHVTVRARPLSPEDVKTSPWKVSGNSIFIPNSSNKFEFDRVFEADCKTEEIYRARTKELVAAAVGGFNGTVFAYGQTNSGKTHTMRGAATEPGVIPLAVRDLFDTIQQDVDREFLLRMSYMEIYNEDINDLLAPEHRKLQIHESIERGIYVAGLREEIVTSPQQVLDFMQFGESHRHIGETNMNLYSSRSHTIFRMIIESRDRTEDEDVGNCCDAVRVSVLNLVDLAGSERAAKTGAEGVRLKEGSHINKSLMTLGTVIKKLSEGAESQGGHVPYRDSKLTRILQPSLGGNANTAIICNITLAQIHTDETKSSLQFASRALRVTNCAHVNEILTDAALLKRQKKEIEELRAKLQGSHSGHLEEEILNLRNTLLQSALERERITLELEEEKRVQAEREKVLQEQAKKIENLSSMVLHSNRDESHHQQKRGKRRDTWCPSKVSWQNVEEVDPNIQSRASSVKPVRGTRDIGPLVPFDDLVNENEGGGKFIQKLEDFNNSLPEDCILPDAHALLHVTNRRKAAPKKKGYVEEDHELVEVQSEYEELLMKFETERTMSQIQIDCLMRQLADTNNYKPAKCISCSTNHGYTNSNHMEKDVSLRESEAIHVIKQLQEKIMTLEMEKSSSQQNLDSTVELATEQSIFAREKFEELHEEIRKARFEARSAREQLASKESAKLIDLAIESELKLSNEIEDIVSEVKNSTKDLESVTSLLDEVVQSYSTICSEFKDFKNLMRENSQKQTLIFSNHKKFELCMMQKVAELENEKLHLYNQSIDLQQQIEKLEQDELNYEEYLSGLSEQHNLEKENLLQNIQSLEREISSSYLAKEKENMRKDLEKTKVKLKETEFKLKSAIQEKIKFEGEKSFAEREVKRLHGQNNRLERDINKRESLAGRRRDSFVESSKGFDPRNPKGLANLSMQEDYKKLEVLAFEMEATIGSLEEEKEELILSKKLELEALYEELNSLNTNYNMLEEENLDLKQRLEESILNRQKLENDIKLLVEGQQELGMQLSNSLLEMEEEKAIWMAKEKISVATIEEKTNLYNAEVSSLSKALLEVGTELESCREECEVLKETLTCSEEKVKWELHCSMEKSLEINQLKDDINRLDAEIKQVQEEEVKNGKEKAKLRMMLRGTQAKLDAYRFRYEEQVDESGVMNKQYHEATKNLKQKLAFLGEDNLNLKKQLVTVKGTSK